MKSRPTADRHVEPRIALDYLDGTLDTSGQRGVEAHLGLPCPACHELMRALGALIQRMRLDRVPPVPASLRARALGVFDPGERPSAVRQVAERVARLLFDSWSDPLPAAHAARSARRGACASCSRAARSSSSARPNPRVSRRCAGGSRSRMPRSTASRS